MIHSTITHWRNKDIALNEGASPDTILNLEKQLDFTFPDDFRVFFQSINGFKGNDWTPNMFSLLSLEKIKEEYELDPSEQDFIPICDYLIASHFLGYVKGQTGIFKSYGDPLKEKVCETLIEMLDLIEHDDKCVY